MLETDLYNPVKQFLEEQGYQVKAEIINVDVFAVKEEKTIAVELKTNVTLKLIYQAIDRQKLSDDVYIAVPKKAIEAHKKNMRDFLLLLKRLSVGLLVIESNKVEVLQNPIDYNFKQSINRNKRKRAKLINEFNNIGLNNNKGGSKGKRMTFYRENVILIASLLFEKPGLSPKDIKKITKVDKTYSILQKNYYGWFEKKARASYALTDLGKSTILSKINNDKIID
ncbi:MAG: DUF2161 family putative PD-(D/E)XK-type phosphodiesterase [Candidatus Izemoplasmatales bacterium]